MAIDWEHQQHAEERNERELAEALGGRVTGGSAPVDVVVSGRAGLCGIELKTLVTQGNDKITMKTDAMLRKHEWAESNGASLHTVVFDDRNPSERRVYYRIGVGSFRIGNMDYLSGGLQELSSLLHTA